MDQDYKRREARGWLAQFERRNLPTLRLRTFPVSDLASSVTFVCYSFSDHEDDFDFAEFAILHSWDRLGRCPVSLVTDRISERMRAFAGFHNGWVNLFESDTLVVGDIHSLSEDMLLHLARYFSTPYCLTIQDDGIPLGGPKQLRQFLEKKYDYVGAPSVVDSWRQVFADLLLRDWLNGGFSLRSSRLCEAVSRSWPTWGRKWMKRLGAPTGEDFFYTVGMRYNPLNWIRFRYPSAKTARTFSVIDFLGGVDITSLNPAPFGVHGPTTIRQSVNRLYALGYNMP